jgi:glutamine amidotransferase
MKSVAIIDYGMGNLDSVARAVEECGARPLVTDDPGDLASATSIILPGVGSFSEGMRNIRRLGFDAALEEEVLGNGIPFLGLCLGMHLIAARGSEGGDTPGFGWIDAEIVRLEPRDAGERVPHVGWNEVHLLRASLLFPDPAVVRDFYFVHSYYLQPVDPEVVLATTPYCGGFPSVIGRDNIFGVQFHPEKSRRAGFDVLGNFLAL